MYLKETILASTIVFCFGVVMFMEFLYPTIRESSVIVKEVYIEQESPDFVTEVEEIKSTSLNKSKLKHLLIYIHGLSHEYHVPFDLVKSVIHTESSWNHKAVSTSGAIGLMQVKPSTAMSEFKTPEQDLYDPYVNVTVGIMYLSELYHNSGDDWHYALTSYSHGPTATKRYTANYVYNNFYIDKVNKYLKEFKLEEKDNL
jgi:soluble lytic murein transglycosylase-like protein